MSSRPPILLTHRRLMTCILINQLATPGLGTLMARRVISGTCQLLLALAGCALILVWMFEFFYDMVQRELVYGQHSQPAPWIVRLGMILFGASWFWSLFSSASLWRQTNRQQKGAPCTK
jgi:hypothetical protein